MTLRSSVHQVLDGSRDDPFASAVRLCLAALVVANVAAVVLETVPEVAAAAGAGFTILETFSLTVFSLEYVLRTWCAVEEPRHARPIVGRLRYLATPAAVIDLLSILPSLLSAGGLDLRALRLARLARLVRIAKLGRYSLAVQTLQRVLARKAPDLLSLLFVLVVLLVVSSTLMFHLEHDAQPDRFASIPATMWWGIVTLTTIGYGDLAPVTAGGRALGGLIAVLGIGMFALPAGLLGAAFVDELGKARSRHDDGKGAGAHCPHCGQALPKP
ncbi:MAG: two pore domain potassium channel family protein [Planctomycetes bacterium]|nr:two pore domain potassium channel family protein [Planctomycetota bacterium]